MLNGKKLIGWLAGLVLAPVVGGQEFLIHPQNATVCVGEGAIFTSLVDISGGSPALHWLINGVTYDTWRVNSPIPTDVTIDIVVPNVIRFINNTNSLSLVFNPNTYIDFFNGTEIKVGAIGINGLSDTSNTAYLFYENKQQSSITGLTHTITNTTAQVYWNELDSNFITQYLFGVYDANNNLVANYTLNTTHANYDLPSRTDDSCQPLTVKVTAEQCPDPDNSFDQTEAATFTINCPTSPTTPITVTPTEPETEVSGESSGTQTLSPSSLPVLVAATFAVIYQNH